MEINGCDFILPGNPPAKTAVLATLRRHWPNLVVEDDGEDYFIYRDAKAKESWDGVGLTDDNDDDMVYVLPRQCETTVVIGNSRKNLYLVEEIELCMT